MMSKYDQEVKQLKDMIIKNSGEVSEKGVSGHMKNPFGVSTWNKDEIVDNIFNVNHINRNQAEIKKSIEENTKKETDKQGQPTKATKQQSQPSIEKYKWREINEQRQESRGKEKLSESRWKARVQGLQDSDCARICAFKILEKSLWIGAVETQLTNDSEIVKCLSQSQDGSYSRAIDEVIHIGINKFEAQLTRRENKEDVWYFLSTMLRIIAKNGCNMLPILRCKCGSRIQTNLEYKKSCGSIKIMQLACDKCEGVMSEIEWMPKEFFIRIR